MHQRKLNGRVADLVIQRDTDPPDPRTWNNLGVMACWHRQYQLGDVQPNRNGEYLDTWVEKNAPKGSVVLPVYMMDHSGLRVSTTYDSFRAADSGRWDWGQLGVIVATPEAIRKHLLVTRITKKVQEEAKKALEAEVRTYDLFLQKECWTCFITDDDGEEEVYGGFLGSTLDETSIADNIPDAAHFLLNEAWEKRREPSANA